MQPHKLKIANLISKRKTESFLFLWSVEKLLADYHEKFKNETWFISRGFIVREGRKQNHCKTITKQLDSNKLEGSFCLWKNKGSCPKGFQEETNGASTGKRRQLTHSVSNTISSATNFDGKNSSFELRPRQTGLSMRRLGDSNYKYYSNKNMHSMEIQVCCR